MNRRDANSALLFLPLNWMHHLDEEPLRPLTAAEAEFWYEIQWTRPFDRAEQCGSKAIGEFQTTVDLRPQYGLPESLVPAQVHHHVLFGNAGSFVAHRQRLIDAIGECVELSQQEKEGTRPLYDELFGGLFGRGFIDPSWPAVAIVMCGYITTRKRFAIRKTGISDEIMECRAFRPTDVRRLRLEFDDTGERSAITLSGRAFSQRGRSPLCPPPDRPKREQQIVIRQMRRQPDAMAQSDFIYQAAIAGWDDLPAINQGKYYPKPLDAAVNVAGKGYTNATFVVLALVMPVGSSAQVHQVNVCWDRLGNRLLDFNSVSRSFGSFVSQYPVEPILTSMMGLQRPEGV